jgi:cation transport ATPase
MCLVLWQNGINPLAVAGIGVSMEEGTTMTMKTSDMNLMNSQLTKLSYAINMGE